jgi:anti-anti-sigma factor
MPFEIDISPRPDPGTVIAIRGELDVATAGEAEKVTQAAVGRPGPLLLDLSDCAFVDSTGLRFVLRLNRKLADGRPGMAVLVRQPNVWRAFSLTAINKRLPVFADRGEADRWLQAATARYEQDGGVTSPKRA